MAAARRLLLAQPRAKVMMFGAAEDAGSITAALTGGVRGYLRWDASEQNLLGALAHTLSTTAALSTQTPARGRAGLGSQLSERELQILHRMSQGKTNAEIGHELVLAQDVIKSHARRLFPKLGAKDRAEAVAHGFRRGLIS
jgi:DNA-binding NarL/FixJ family response regulator